MVHVFILYVVGLLAPILSVFSRQTQTPPRPLSAPRSGSLQPRPALLCSAHHTPFPPASAFLLQHIKLIPTLGFRHILNNKFLFLSSVCACVSFPAPTKKGKKRKAQREEEQSNKTRRTLTSKEVCALV